MKIKEVREAFKSGHRVFAHLTESWQGTYCRDLYPDIGSEIEIFDLDTSHGTRGYCGGTHEPACYRTISLRRARVVNR